MKTRSVSRGALRASLLTLAVSGSSLLASEAHAGIDPCGDIHVEANAECKLEVESECELKCEPVAFEASCAAELHAECSGRCDASAKVECTGSCDIDACEASCEDVTAPKFSCQGECEASAEANCDAKCSGSARDGEAEGECRASCRATANAECEASCEATPPTANCKAKCEASCEGQCTAEARTDCQVDCQSSGYADCKLSAEGGCEGRCEEPEGALFCDGQYVDHGGNLAECKAALKAALDIEVKASARGESECSDGSCQAEGEASASCAMARPSRASNTLLFALGLALSGGVLARRRRAGRG